MMYQLIWTLIVGIPKITRKSYFSTIHNIMTNHGSLTTWDKYSVRKIQYHGVIIFNGKTLISEPASI